MDIFKKEDFEKLSLIQDTICISIYIPTHESGMEVNEGIDTINFKNEIQKVQHDLKARGLSSQQITHILSPAYELIADEVFWKSQSKALAVFLQEHNFWKFRIPLSLELSTHISSMFDLTPMIPLLSEEEFYTLSLTQNRIRLFKNSAYTFEEINFVQPIPQSIKEVFAMYEFQTEEKEKNMVKEGLARTPGKGPLPSHGSQPQDDQYLYLMEFLRSVNKGVSQTLKGQKAPLIVAAVDNVFSLYKKVNTYAHLIDQPISGNPDRYSERQLHEKALQAAGGFLTKSRLKDLEKYTAWAGTGKTSSNLEDILNASFDGRVESLFIIENMHVWGKYDERTRAVTIHTQKQENDVCLFGLAVAKTIENSGNAYLVSSSEMAAKNTASNIAATFRY